jgi:hypothetical protein
LERLTYLAYGLMEPDEKLKAAAHVTGCAACAETVRRLEAERGMVVEATQSPEPSTALIRKINGLVHERTSAIRRARSRRIWMFSVAAGALVVIGMAFAMRMNRISDERSAIHAGRVSVQRGDRWTSESKGYMPASGDRLRVEDASGATLRLEEGSLFQLRQGSLVEFRGNRGPKAVLRLLAGEVHCNVVPDPRPFSIEAEGALLTVVGTEFIVHVLEDPPAFQPEERIPRLPNVSMRVISGVVVFSTGGGQIRVPAGWIALAGHSGPPWLWGTEEEFQRLLHNAVGRAIGQILGQGVKSVGPEGGPRDAAWRERTDDVVKERVGAVPWTRLAKALVPYHREVENAVKEKRALNVEADVTVDLGLGWGKVKQLADELGVPPADFMEACRNRLASFPFAEAIVGELAGGPLTEDQRRGLPVAELVDNLLPLIDPKAPALAQWKARAERTLRFVRQMKEILTGEQFLHLTQCVGPSWFMKEKDYQVWGVEGASVEEAADRVVRIWKEQFRLPPSVEAPLGTIAAQHVRNHLEELKKFRVAHPEALTGIEELELSILLLDLQAAAEKRVSQIPSLNDETRKRAIAGSNSLIRIKVVEAK